MVAFVWTRSIILLHFHVSTFQNQFYFMFSVTSLESLQNGKDIFYDITLQNIFTLKKSNIYDKCHIVTLLI
jgi:hypothetical protein